MKSLTCFLMIMGVFGSSLWAQTEGRAIAPFDKRIALVVGNSAYEHVQALANPINDATDMAASLQRKGFVVTLLKDATLRQMKQAITQFGRDLQALGDQPESVGLFFYAGHGVQYEGVNYLIPVDANIPEANELEFEAVDANRLLNKMEDAKNEFNIVILDACRDNPYRSWSRSTRSGLAEMKSPRGSFLAFATAPGEVAADGVGNSRNSPFTKHFLLQMEQPLDLLQMFKQVIHGVSVETHQKQWPWQNASMTGNFYFTPPPPSTTPSPTTPLPPQGDPELDMWNLVKGSIHASDVRRFINAYPNPQGRFFKVAQLKLDQLERQQAITQVVTTTTSPPITLQTALVQPPSEPEGIWTEPQDVWTEPHTGIRMVSIPGGSFEMGDLFDEGYRDEKMIRTVRLDTFWLGETEVTQGQWKAIMGENDREPHFKGDDLPMEQVSWEDAQRFIKTLNAKHQGRYQFRLPSEAEWEYACREGGKKVRFGNGQDTADPSQMNFIALAVYKKSYSVGGQYRAKTVPAKSFSPNAFGLYQMSGNVSEWVEDKYTSDYSNVGTENPIYARLGDYRVIRGGSWNLFPENVRCAYRDSGFSPGGRGVRNDNLGFRLARTR